MRYYHKMFFTFTTIAIIYTLVIEAIFLGGYRLSQNAEFTRSSTAIAKQMVDYTDSRMQSVQEISMLIQSSEYTGKYLQELPNEPNRFSRLKLHSFLNSIFGVIPTQMDAIAVTKIVDDYAILNNGTGDLAFFSKEFNLSQEELTNMIDSFNKDPNKSLSFLKITDKSDRTLYILVSRQWLGRPYPLYMFTAFYENQLFHTEVNDFGTFVMLYQNEVVTSVGTLSPKQVTEALGNADFPARQDIVSSSLSGLRYVYFADPPRIITPVFLLIICCGLLALTISFALMYLITKKMYTPIKGILHAIGRGTASGDEFAYVRETIQSLHDDVATMSTSLEKYKCDAEDKFFCDLLLGMIPPDQLKQKLSQYHFSKAGGPFVAVIIRFIETTDLNVDFTHNMIIEIKQNMVLALNTLFQSSDFCKITDMNFETQVLIISEGNISALSELLRNMLISFEPEYGLSITAVIGSPCNDIEGISASYQDAFRMIDFNEFSPHGAKVITTQETKSVWMDTVYYPLSLEQTLVNAILHSKTTVWQSTLDEIVNTNQNERNASISQLSLMLTATVSRIIDGLNEKASDIFDENFVIYLEFRSCRTYEELRKKSLEVFETLAAWMQQKREQSNNGIAATMLEYLHQNYNNDISLFDLADFLNLSRNYVSTLFKNVTGRNFKDYLNEYRFKMACDTMKCDPNKKVKEIAKMVGCNTDILSRLFVRYAGMTPSDYQKQINR